VASEYLSCIREAHAKRKTALLAKAQAVCIWLQLLAYTVQPPLFELSKALLCSHRTTVRFTKKQLAFFVQLSYFRKFYRHILCTKQLPEHVDVRLHAGLWASGNRVRSLAAQREVGPLTYVVFQKNSFLLQGSIIIRLSFVIFVLKLDYRGSTVNRTQYDSKQSAVISKASNEFIGNDYSLDRQTSTRYNPLPFFPWV
jgi:hypothetical protein